MPRFAMQQDPDRSFRGSWSSGMQSTSAAASFNLAKAIVGAGSFSLPYVCKNQGVLGGLITISSCAMLAWYTMQVQARCYPPVPRDYFLRPVYACACLHVCKTVYECTRVCVRLCVCLRVFVTFCMSSACVPDFRVSVYLYLVCVPFVSLLACLSACLLACHACMHT